MPLVINTNITAVNAGNHLVANDSAMKESLAKLSSGNRIVSGADDAAGLAVSSKMNSTLQRNMRVRENLNNAISFLQVQEGALQVVGV